MNRALDFYENEDDKRLIISFVEKLKPESKYEYKCIEGAGCALKTIHQLPYAGLSAALLQEFASSSYSSSHNIDGFGTFNSRSGVITLDLNEKVGIKSISETLIHELAHAIDCNCSTSVIPLSYKYGLFRTAKSDAVTIRNKYGLPYRFWPFQLSEKDICKIGSFGVNNMGNGYRLALCQEILSGYYKTQIGKMAHDTCYWRSAKSIYAFDKMYGTEVFAYYIVLLYANTRYGGEDTLTEKFFPESYDTIKTIINSL